MPASVVLPASEDLAQATDEAERDPGGRSSATQLLVDIKRERAEIAKREAEASPAAGSESHDLLWKIAVPVALVLILAVGAVLRLTGVNWDDYTHLHPDERFITMVETSIAWPKSLGEFFDTAHSPLNPYNRGYNSFVYGTFPLFLVKWLGMLLNMQGYDQIDLVGRVVSALFDLGSVLLAALTGLRLFGRRTAVLAALLTAGSVIQIQQSHFFTFDTFIGFFLMASFFFAVRIWKGPRWYDYPLLGASLGLAMASKINAALFALIVLVVAFKQLREVTLAFPNERTGEWMSVVGRFSGAALVGLLVFRIAEPYAFTGPGFLNIGLSSKFLNDMFYVQKLITGEMDQPPSIEWAGTTPYLFPLRNLMIWGMGLPFGIVGWAGFLFGAYQLFRRRDSNYLLLVAWVGFFFAYEGDQFAKTMRYFVPIVPLLAILGAQALVHGFDWARERTRVSSGLRPRVLPRVALYGFPALGVVVAIGTILYAFAFVGIYTRPLTRVAATEWIFANIPRGTPIANESSWDDALPTRWHGRDAGWYSGVNLDMYAADTPQRATQLADDLDKVQYIFFSSDRVYDSIPRMPMRYPLSTEFYKLLFSDQLGFRVVKTFTSYPTLFGIQINDDSAEEIFRNYDHPKVLIFEKMPNYSSARVHQLLAAVPLDNVLQIKASETQFNGLLLSNAERQIQQLGGTWSELYDRPGLTNRFPTIFWWLTLELLGLLALPLAWRLFGRFADRGYGFAKVLGLLVVTYVAWLLPSLHLLAFGPIPILVGMGFVAAVSVVMVGKSWQEFVRFVATNRKVILVHESVFLAAFGLFWVIRLYNPDLWQLYYGGEKPMEFAYINAIAKSTYFPPYDPWFAGGYINYYYFGFVIVATLIRFTGIVPAVAFNLAIPSIFAMTAAGLFSFGLNYASSLRRVAGRVLTLRNTLIGLMPVFFVLIVGNLDGFIQRLESLWALSGLQFKSSIPGLEGLVKAVVGLEAVLLGGKVFPALDFWRSTRLIGSAENPTPIMEFPYFTFLYGDLHPHMIAMPLATLALGLTIAIVWQGVGGKDEGTRGRGDGEKWGVGGTVSGGSGEWATPVPTTRDSGLRTQDSELRTWHSSLLTHDSSLVERGLTIVIGGLVVGALEATNSWDYPTYLVLLSAAYLVAAFFRDRAITLDGIVGAGVSAVLTFIVAQILFMPYTRSYELFYNGVDPSPAKTDIHIYLVMFGLPLFFFGTALLIGLARNRWHRFRLRGYYEWFRGSARWDHRKELWRMLVRPSPWMELLPWAVLLLGVIAVMAAVVGLYLIALLILLCGVALLSLFERDISPQRMMLVLFVGLGAVLTMAVEFVTIKGDIGRMNTVFKFYIQAWYLYGIAGALLAASLVTRWKSDRSGWRPGWRQAWIAVAVLLFAAAMVYPFGATPAKVGARFAAMPPTLDGMAYMKVGSFTDQNKPIVLAHDYDAITWLQDHIAGSPVVLEAQIPEYRWGSRVSIYTGLPTVLGWTWHQRQQRVNYGGMIDQRITDIQTMYQSTVPSVVMTLLQRYDVSLIYVGDLERAYYPSPGLEKFNQMVALKMLSIVYDANGVVIYQVNRPGQPSVVLPGASAGGSRTTGQG